MYRCLMDMCSLISEGVSVSRASVPDVDIEEDL